jgi:hypothetical protein
VPEGGGGEKAVKRKRRARVSLTAPSYVNIFVVPKI